MYVSRNIFINRYLRESYRYIIVTNIFINFIQYYFV